MNRGSHYVAKDKIKVSIETTEGRLDGEVHVMFRHRPSDLLNDDNKFIPVTNATLTPTQSGAPARQYDFLALSKQHIVFLTEEGGREPGGGD